MNFFFIYLNAIANIGICQAYASYLNGIHQLLINPTKVCLVGSTSIHDDLITFGDTFAKPPQVMLFLSKYEMARYDNNFILEIHDTTETYFYIKFQCFADYRQISNFNVRWVAVDDERIKVINKRIDVLMTTPQTITEIHGIKNAVKGFISILSFKFGGIQNYQINNLQINGDQVSVVYTPAAGSTMTRIGFQIVVGTDLVFTIDNNLSTGKITNASPFYFSVSEIADTFLQIPIQGQHWITLDSFYNLIVGLNTPLTQCTFKVNAVGAQTPEFENIYYQKLLIKTNKYSVPTTFLYHKMRITKKKYSNTYPVQLFIDELVQYFYPGNSQQFTLGPTIYSLNIVTSISCPYCYKLVGHVVQNISPILQNFDISTNCYKGINFVEHHIKLVQKDSVYQQIQISVTTTSITITELYGDPLPINTMTLLFLNLVIT